MKLLIVTDGALYEWDFHSTDNARTVGSYYWADYAVRAVISLAGTPNDAYIVDMAGPITVVDVRLSNHLQNVIPAHSGPFVLHTRLNEKMQAQLDTVHEHWLWTQTKAGCWQNAGPVEDKRDAFAQLQKLPDTYQPLAFISYDMQGDGGLTVTKVARFINKRTARFIENPPYRWREVN